MRVTMAATNDNCMNFRIMSFNMHGFHQGCPIIDDMITQYNPDVFFTTRALANSGKPV